MKKEETIVTEEISREEVVALFGEEHVAQYEKNLMLGVDRPLVKKEKKANKGLGTFIGILILLSLVTLVWKFKWFVLSVIGVCCLFELIYYAVTGKHTKFYQKNSK